MKRLTVILILASFFGLLKEKGYAQCSAVFTVQSKVCEGSNIAIQSFDTNRFLKHYWNFGDVFSGASNIDSVANPGHIFSGNGNYKITHIVKDTKGCSDTIDSNLRIYSKPVASYTFSNACNGLLTAFTNISVADSGDAVVKWFWDFGNGKKSNSKDTVFSFNSVGKNAVSLIILSAKGCSDTLVKTIDIFKKPTGKLGQTSACKGSQINFTADTLSKAISFLWDFGDSSFFSVRNASHVFKKTGYVYPILTVDYGTTKCFINLDSILIHPLPDASFSIVKDTQCYTGNQVCVKPNIKNTRLKSRVVIYDDGFFDDITPLKDSVICHSYSDIKGGKYFITIELTDSNNCFASFTSLKPVIIYPELKAAFTITGGNGCFTTKISFNNQSNTSPPTITKFLWDFGDSTKDSLNWTGLSHTYTKDGLFKMALTIYDKYGCVSTYTDNKGIRNTNYTLDPVIDSSRSKCRSSNVFGFKQTPISGASILWEFTASDSAKTFSAQFHFPYIGKYYPRITINKNGCISRKIIGPVLVYGPSAAIGNITNQFQCQIKDTVYFENNSTLYYNGSSVVFWDSGDPYAAACTTSTKQAYNIGKNCRYSKDSMYFKHMYKKGKEACYYTQLLVVDTVTGCRDSTWAALPLMAPKAKGLFTLYDNSPCPGPESYKSITFDLNQSQPTCLKYSWLVMWDSLSAAKTGNFDSCWAQNTRWNNFTYNKYAGDSNGNVTMGLIVENGLDTNGRTCRDTGWFHNIANVIRLNPNFVSNYNPQQYYCINSTLRFFPLDSNQSKGNRFNWNFGDGTIIDTAFQGSIKHTYKKSGNYRVILTIRNPGGCIGDTSMRLNIGVYKSFGISSFLKCVGDSLKITEYNRYYDTMSANLNFWSNPIRKNAGKELLKYNLGDGKGFQDIGPNPTFAYKVPGSYTILMALKDSAGCWDTLAYPYNLGIAGVYANFKLPQDSVLCGQTLDLVSLSSTVDSISMKGLMGDSIVIWEWDFGTKYAKSARPNPRRFFAIGDYKIKLKVTNTVGCKDSIEKNIVFIGPKARFDFISDTVGCEPLAVTFVNKSQNATDYIWQFNDLFNNAFGTDKDTNVTFRYRGHGTFYPLLVARGLFTKNGISQVCDDYYPDTSLSFRKTVTVWELPKPDFKWITNCSNATTSFTNKSTISTGSIVSVKWDFGDGTYSNGINPVHTYADTGYYRVVLKTISDHGCKDSIVKTIVVSLTPFANFGFTNACQGVPNLFSDSSFAFNDRIYLWQWDFGDGTTSLLKNPSRIFAKDTTYFVKLKVTNVAGCFDSSIKQVLVNSNPKPDFSFVNVCDQRRMVFKNQSSSKQNLQSWRWDFGDSTFSTNWNDSHLYKRPANYSVKLNLLTINGCKDSVQKSFSVYPNPKAKIFVNSHNQCFKYNNFRLSDSSKIISGALTSIWDLGDLNTSIQSNLNHKYNSYGSYKLRLISISNYGCRDTTFDTVRVYAMPQVSFTINQNNQCSRYNAFVFKETGSIPQGNYTILWKFGNGDSSKADPANYHYKDTGVFNPILILTSDKGCKDTSVAKVQLYPMPKSAFYINDTGQCFRTHKFDFTNTSTLPYGTLNHRWEFGDGTGFNGVNSSHVYNKDGTYKVLLETESIFGCKDSVLNNVFVYPMPVSGFNINDSLQCLAGNQFKFTNKSSISSGTLSYKWDFGDLVNSGSQNPNHTYFKYGNYQVMLSSGSLFNCYDTVFQVLEVYPMPVIKPFVNLSNQCVNNQNFQFYDSNTIAKGGLSQRWKFGDNTISNLSKPNKTYAKDGIYTVWLVATSNFLCTDSASLKINVYAKPIPLFSVNDTDQCFTGNNFIFKNKTSIGSGTFTQKWNFGDGSSQLTLDAFHTYLTFGNYKVTLYSYSNFGCTDSIFSNIIVYPMPVPAFMVNSNEQCIRGNQFVFTNNSKIATGTLSYKWNFGDTGSSVKTSPTYIYTKTGNFVARLKATSQYGCIDSSFDFTAVNPMPQSGFKINDTAQCQNNQNFVFTDTSRIAYGGISRLWRFDDGSTSTLSSVSRKFIQDTTHKITLIQTSNRGCTDSISKWIEVYSIPNQSFSINDTDQCLRQNRFVFNNTGFVKKGTLTFQWDFGDKTGSSSVQTFHRYLAYGNYTVTLSSLTDMGCVDTLRKLLRVDPMPITSFSVNDTGQCVNNQNFIFKNNMSIPVGTLQHIWRFGDGSSSLLKDPSHQYTKDSFYIATLSAVSNKGCKDSSEKIMAVFPKPNINFKINDSIQCLYLNQFLFTNTSQIKYGTLTFVWKFRDGATSNNVDAKHIYTNSANYNVGLQAVSDLGCVDTFFKTIVVGAMPKVDFLVNDRGQCLKSQNFIFSNRSSIQSGTMRHKWYFGDTDTITSLSANHRYKVIGNFKPKLISTSQYGCRDSFSRDVWINPNAWASFTTNDSDQCKNQQNYVFTNTSSVSPGKIIALLWNLGNGKTSNQQQTGAYYPVSGTYTIILQTTTDSSCLDSALHLIKVYPKPAAWFTVNDSAQCLYGNQYEFTDVSFDTLGVNQYLWDINKETSVTTKIANYSFNSPGYKIITLVATSSRGCADTSVRQVYVKPMPDPRFERLKKYYCELTGPYSFVANTPGGQFSGKNIQLNQYNPVLLWEDTVYYKVTVNGCTDSSYQITNVYPGPVVNLGNDTTLCKFETLDLIISSWQSTYYWSNGTNRSNLEVLTLGIYTVVVSNICGTIYDTIKVSYRPVNCRFFLPTAFSPNGDGINDFYKPSIFNVAEMKYQIFSRWGELLYEGDVNDKGWDGNYNGEMAQEDAFIVYVSYSYINGARFVKLTEKGTFILLR